MGLGKKSDKEMVVICQYYGIFACWMFRGLKWESPTAVSGCLIYLGRHYLILLSSHEFYSLTYLASPSSLPKLHPLTKPSPQPFVRNRISSRYSKRNYPTLGQIKNYNKYTLYQNDSYA